MYNPILIFIAIFVYLAASSEAHMVALRAVSRGVPVSHAMMTHFATLMPDAHVDEAVQTLLATSQGEFPVVDGAGKPVGLLGRGGIIKAIKTLGPDAKVADAMSADLPTISHRQSLEQAFKLLQEKQAAAVGITNAAGKLVGLVTSETIAEMMMLQNALPKDAQYRPLEPARGRVTRGRTTRPSSILHRGVDWLSATTPMVLLPIRNPEASMTKRLLVPTRRQFLSTTAAAAAFTGLGGIASPFISRAADRPLVSHGVQSGDVSVDSGVVWARADRPSRMMVEVATTESFKNARHAGYVDALPDSDFTAKMLVENLPAGQDIFYRLRFQDLASPTIVGEPTVGRFRTAPADRRSISFAWSGDTAGQGWGIDEIARRHDAPMPPCLKNRPDFFIHNGDNIYADGAIHAEQKMPNGEIWKNIVTEEKSKPAETLAEFRGAYKYNMLDKNVRALLRRGAGVLAVGRPRGVQQLVAGRADRQPRLPQKTEIHREEQPHHGRARQPRLP